MKKSLLAGLIATTFVILPAHADLKNIATASLQSTTEEVAACTIIATGGLTYQGYKVLVVYAEGSSSLSDPKLTVRSLTRGDSYTNDNWQDTVFYQGQAISVGANLANLYRGTLGRTPANNSAAAAVVLFSPGEPVCAFSREVSNPSLQRVAVSITDITNQVQGARSLTTQEHYLLDDWVNVKN